MEATQCLAAAEPVLDGYYQTLFGVVRDRLRGRDGAPPPDPPSELVPFLRFKAPQAVSRPQVRKALRDLLAVDPALAPAVAAAHASRVGDPEPSAISLHAAVEAGDVALLHRLASQAAATRPDGWERLVAAAALADVALGTGRAAGEADGRRRAEAAARRSAGTAERLAGRVEALEAALARAEADVARLREERNAARAELATGARAVEREADRADAACAEADAWREKTGDLSARVERLTAALRGQERAAAEAEAALRSRVAGLEAALIPDLEPHALALERLAGELRETMRHMAGTGGDESGPPRRRRADFPKGIFPDSAAAVQWALGRPDLVILVDGYNVSRQVLRGWGDRPLPQQRELLLTRCEQVLRAGGAEMWIVFDSSEPGGSGVGRRTRPGLHVEFSGGPTADDRLVQIVHALDPAVAVVAVTSDRELQGRVAALGAAPVPSEVFLEAIGAPLR